MATEVTIVGQGLAGTCLAWRLWDRGVQFRLLHCGSRRSTSLISAGLLTPVTGRKLNPSWRLEEFLPEAMSFYRNVEMVLGEQFFREVPIVRLFADDEERARLDAHEDHIRSLEMRLELAQGAVEAVQAPQVVDAGELAVRVGPLRAQHLHLLQPIPKHYH